MEVISTHVSSDFDSFAGMIAAKKIFPDAEILLPSSINSNVRKFIALHEDELPPLKEPGEIDVKSIQRIIMIDTKIPARLGILKEMVDQHKAEVIIFDHHQKSSEDIDYGSDFSKNFGATTSIIVDIIKKRKINLTPLEATLFSLGIYEDTGSFTFPGTTFKDFEAAAFLKKQGANHLVITRFLNLSLTGEQHRLLEKLIANLKKITIYETDILFSNATSERFVEGLSVLTRKLGQVEDVDVVFCWVKMKEKIYLVGRSEDSKVDVSKVLEPIGGGGHPQAASAIIKDMQFEQIEKKIIDALRKNIKKPVLAKDIMSYPIRTVSEDESIINASELLKKYGHTGIPIVGSNGKLSGIITRKDIDKAIKHGLSHAPVKGFRSHGIITTGPATTIDEIQRLMIENGIGRIPVVYKGEVVGIVTRKDILRFMHGKNYLKYPVKTREGRGYNFNPNEIKERLYSLFPENITQIFETVSDISRELKVKAFLVGGVVRDLLLGIPNLDIDIVIEGDGIAFAQKVATAIGAKIDSHEKFRTAVLVLENGQHIDIASSRVEYYEKPAALPSVEPGSIRQDLARRDFTINTLALSLSRNNFGEIMDFFGGRKDLTQKRIKILHKLSFIEDPTRIFRAVRFEQRLGFKMDNITERLAISTIDMNIVTELTGIRIRDELISILKEKMPWAALERLFELKALKKIGVEALIDEDFIKLSKKVIERKESLAPYLEHECETWRLLLVLLLSGKNPESAAKWCYEMKIKNRDIAVIKNSISSISGLKQELGSRVYLNSGLYKMLHNTPEELKVLISCFGKNYYDNVMRYLTRLRHIKLEITGNDLKSLGYGPSKGYKKVFDKLFEKKLDGKLKSRQEELADAAKILSIIATGK